MSRDLVAELSAMAAVVEAAVAWHSGHGIETAQEVAPPDVDLFVAIDGLKKTRDGHSPCESKEAQGDRPSSAQGGMAKSDASIDRGPKSPLPWARCPEDVFVLGPGGIVARRFEDTDEWHFDDEHIDLIIHSCNSHHALCDRAEKAEARVRELEAEDKHLLDDLNVMRSDRDTWKEALREDRRLWGIRRRLLTKERDALRDKFEAAQDEVASMTNHSADYRTTIADLRAQLKAAEARAEANEAQRRRAVTRQQEAQIELDSAEATEAVVPECVMRWREAGPDGFAMVYVDAKVLRDGYEDVGEEARLAAGRSLEWLATASPAHIAAATQEDEVVFLAYQAHQDEHNCGVESCAAAVLGAVTRATITTKLAVLVSGGGAAEAVIEGDGPLLVDADGGVHDATELAAWLRDKPTASHAYPAWRQSAWLRDKPTASHAYPAWRQWWSRRPDVAKELAG